MTRFGVLSVGAISDQSIFPDPGFSAGWTIDPSGIVVDDQANTLETWLTSGVASDFEVKAHKDSGNTSPGNLDLYFPLSGGACQWSIIAGGSTVFCTLTITLRRIADGWTDTATIVLNAQPF